MDVDFKGIVCRVLFQMVYFVYRISVLSWGLVGGRVLFVVQENGHGLDRWGRS